MKRIIGHWTAGGPTANATDRKHYHEIIERDGTVVSGNHAVEDNVNTADGVYAAHTRGLNTDSIGLSCAGMRGAKERPLVLGNAPITRSQFNKMAERAAYYCRKYGMQVTPRTVLTHAEVQGTLGVKQRNKWDYTILPWDPSISGAKACGDYFRAQVSQYLNTAGGLAQPKQINKRIRWLQRLLIARGYDLGTADGVIGQKTVRALNDFQQTIGLPITGKFDTATVAELREVEEGPPKNEKPITKSRTAPGAGSAAIGGAIIAIRETLNVIEEQKDALTSGEAITIGVAVVVVIGSVLALYARLDDGGYLDNLPWRR